MGLRPSGGNPIEGVLGSNAAGSATGGPGSASGPAPDSVHITAGARTLAGLSAAVQASPEVDAQRVATLGAAIDSGSYTIDANRIAAGLLQLEQQLAGVLPQ